MIIKILGSGCPGCQKLAANAEQAAKKLGIKDFKIEKVNDMEKILSYGVLGLPALVVDEKLKLYGRVAGLEEIEQLLQ